MKKGLCFIVKRGVLYGIIYGIYNRKNYYFGVFI